MSTNKMKSAIGDLDSSGIESTVEAVYVYEAPVRLWHWVNAGAITTVVENKTDNITNNNFFILILLSYFNIN
jgi:Ni,Fe-hydrogenase I cytochrome b subunit